jgi:hypothetical protein
LVDFKALRFNERSLASRRCCSRSSLVFAIIVSLGIQSWLLWTVTAFFLVEFWMAAAESMVHCSKRLLTLVLLSTGTTDHWPDRTRLTTTTDDCDDGLWGTWTADGKILPLDLNLEIP